MSYTKFNRHENMSMTTLSEIGDIIGEVRWDSSFDLSNMLFGLYDGYLYEELLPLAEKELDSELYNRIYGVLVVISNYPKL